MMKGHAMEVAQIYYRSATVELRYRTEYDRWEIMNAQQDWVGLNHATQKEVQALAKEVDRPLFPQEAALEVERLLPPKLRKPTSC